MHHVSFRITFEISYTRNVLSLDTINRYYNLSTVYAFICNIMLLCVFKLDLYICIVRLRLIPHPVVI
jgi:hypothetical protein